MIGEIDYNIDTLVQRYPELNSCKGSIYDAFCLLRNCFESGHKLLIAGNGGSSADADHIVGELMKGFKKQRKINQDLAQHIIDIDAEKGEEIADALQQGLPAIALHNHNGLNTAFINDVNNGGEYMFAQQLLTYGNEGDILLGISTSGNSKNVCNAAIVAKAKGLKVIGLVGESGGKLAKYADVLIKAPSKETFIIQEYHLPIYHCLCLMLENHFFR